jgi:putative pyruvate formate lyase activating enzyme
MVRGGTPVSAETFLEIAASLNTGGAENLQVLSPTVHLPSLRLLLAELKKRGYGLPVALKSSGYEDVEKLKPLEGLVDIYIPDLKYGPSSKWASKAGVPDYFEVACASIAEMYRQTGPAVMDRHGILQKGVLVRHVRAPLPKKERKAIDDYMAAMPEGVLVSVQSEFDVMD